MKRPDPVRHLRPEPASLHEALVGLPALLTAQEVCELLRCTTRTLRRWESQGLIRAVRPAGGRPRYERSEIDRLLREGRR